MTIRRDRLTCVLFRSAPLCRGRLGADVMRAVLTGIRYPRTSVYKQDRKILKQGLVLL
jgi:hypothetical protein